MYICVYIVQAYMQTFKQNTGLQLRSCVLVITYMNLTGISRNNIMLDFTLKHARFCFINQAN